MIEHLGESKGITPTEAYRLANMAVDLCVTQLVNDVKVFTPCCQKVYWLKK